MYDCKKEIVKFSPFPFFIENYEGDGEGGGAYFIAKEIAKQAPIYLEKLDITTGHPTVAFLFASLLQFCLRVSGIFILTTRFQFNGVVDLGI